MTLRLIFVAFWAFMFRGTIDDPSRSWRPFWLVFEAAMLAFSVLWALGFHAHEIEKSQRVPPWRA